MPDLLPQPATASAAAAVLAMQGRSLTSLVALLGQGQRVDATAAGTHALLWPSAVGLAHPEQGQWPVAHVLAVLGRGGTRIDRIMLIGSLGRILEERPGPPGYETMEKTP
ncbi:MAG: hypothetical protein L6R48_01060 [Planctomycetes bacterium]|nr:hypothetical protein [Planctomycetota bacterium]